jgi:hypothetical protein
VQGADAPPIFGGIVSSAVAVVDCRRVLGLLAQKNYTGI